METMFMVMVGIVTCAIGTVGALIGVFLADAWTKARLKGVDHDD